MKVFRAQTAVDWQGVRDKVKHAVPLRQGFRLVDWRVRSRGRADCGLCKGHSTGTVAFTERLWLCHRCLRGGSVFDLVMLAHGCSFIDALRLLAEEARIQLPSTTTPEERRRLTELEAQRKRIGSAAGKLDRTEHELRLWYRGLIHRCEQKQEYVRQRLGELHGGARNDGAASTRAAGAGW